MGKRTEKQELQEKAQKKVKTNDSEEEDYSEEDIPEFNEVQMDLIQKWHKQTNNLKDFIFEGEDSDLKLSDFSKEEQDYVKLYNEQPEYFKDFVMNLDQEIAEADFGDFEEEEIKFIERWNEQSDKLRDFIIEGDSDQESQNFNDDEKQFLVDFKKQSERVQEFCRQEQDDIELDGDLVLSEEEREFIEEWNKADDLVVDYIMDGAEEGKTYNFTAEQKEFMKKFESQRDEVKNFLRQGIDAELGEEESDYDEDEEDDDEEEV